MDFISILLAKGLVNYGLHLLFDVVSTPECYLCKKQIKDLYNTKCCNHNLCGVCTVTSIKTGFLSFGKKYFHCPLCNKKENL